MPIKEFYLNKVLEGFEMNQDEFIDLCILLGCDYVDKIKVVNAIPLNLFNNNDILMRQLLFFFSVCITALYKVLFIKVYLT